MAISLTAVTTATATLPRAKLCSPLLSDLFDKNAPHCDLCGATNATVRCDMCNNQAFCQACDETYHGHPRRATHSRKAVVDTTSTEKPQLPPKGSEGFVISPPQPPPRKNKKGGILPSSLRRGSPEEENGRTLMGSLKKIMGNRPLPPTPATILDKRRSSVPDMNRNEPRPNPAFSNKSPGSTMTVAIPQSIMELNNKAITGKPPSPMPLGSTAPTQHLRSHHKGQAPLPIRKLSLQQLPNTFDDRRASMADSLSPASGQWDKPSMDTQKTRSQSVSNEQWNHMLAIQAVNPQKGYGRSAAASEVGDVSARHGYNVTRDNPRAIGRGMVSSTSVCDLNTLAQQQHPGPQMVQQSHPYPGMQSANSFQQLSLVNYDPNMMWVQAPPTPCTLCQPQQMYPQPMGPGGMKRTASNISMNLSSMASDISGYPWSGSHAHHHMPMGYPGYYLGCHQHMAPPRCSQGSAMSIPDSMRSFTRMPHSPAPSGRSSSHRSHKSTKSRSFSTADNGGRKSRNHSRKRSEVSDSESSSFSNHENLPAPLPKPCKPGGLAWQCDHCTFINPGHAQACGMCSKVPGRMNNRDTKSGSDYRRSHRRREKTTDSIENVHMSDYDNHQRKGNRRQSHLPSSGSIKSSCGKSKKKSHRQASSSLSSYSDSEDDEGLPLEKQLRNLRLSSRSRAADYDGLSVTSRSKDRGTLKKEGDGRRYRNRRKCHSDRCMTPARSSASHLSQRTSIDSGDSEEEKYRQSNKGDCYVSEQLPMQEIRSSPSHENTVIATTASETNTLQNTNSKDKTSSSKRRRKEQQQTSISSTSLCSSTASGVSESSVSISSDGGEPPENSPIELRERSPPVPLISPELKLNDISVNKSEIKAEVVKDVDDEDREKNMEKIYEENQDDLVPDQNTLQPVNKADVDEPPSFANTLDGIETLRTHEVVDYELGSQYINPAPIDTPEQMTKALQVLMPTLNYIEQQTPELEEKIIKLDYEIYDKLYVDKEQVKELLPHIPSVSPLIIEENVRGNESPKAPKTIPPSSQDPSYEVIDSPEKITNTQVMGKPSENTMIIQEHSVMKQSSQDKSTNKESTIENLFPEENDKAMIRVIDQCEEVAQTMDTSSDKEDFIKMGTSSSENLNDGLSSTRERQQTPLSVSSSDAQFYSPPNSPVLSVNEKLRGKQNLTESQVYEEAGMSEDEQKKVLQQSPSSLGTSLESMGETYDKVHFQDALSSDFAPLARSTSDQHRDCKSKIVRSSSKREQVFATSDEEEIDERHLTVQQIITRRKQKVMKEDGMQLVKILREAEDLGYDPEEVSVAMLMGEKNKSPIEWLQENWRYMVDTVKTLASNYGFERKAKDIEGISAKEAKKALRLHKGDIWAAVTECIEERQKQNKLQPALHHDIEGEAKEEITRMKETTVINLSPSSQSKIKERAESQLSDSDEYLNATSHLPSPHDIQETENEIYANFVNPLLEKLEESLPKKSEGTPLISEELKKKIIQAILEGETEAATDDVVFDSEEESTIEELLAVAENPTFYDYFTAIDLEDFEEYSKVHDQGEEVPIEDESASSSYDSLGIPPNEIKEEEQPEEAEEREQDELGREETEQEENGEVLEAEKNPEEETMSEFEYVEDFKSTENLVTEDPSDVMNRHSNEDLQYIRQEDVVVHPLKAYGHFADLTLTEFDEEDLPRKKESSSKYDAHQVKGSCKFRNPNNEHSISNPKINEASPKMELISSDKPTLEFVQIETHSQESSNRKIFKQILANEYNETKEMENRYCLGNKIAKEAESAKEHTEQGQEEEDESISVMTGRLNLSVTSSLNGRTPNIDVKAQKIEADLTKLHLSSEQDLVLGTDDVPLNAESDEQMVTEEEDSAPGVELQTQITTSQGSPTKRIQATQIVGFAIAKAMARETLVRGSNSPIDGDESLPGTPTPGSNSESETAPEISDPSATMESEEEYLRSLNTIPEEGSELTSKPNSSSLMASSTSASQTKSDPELLHTSVPPAVASFSGPIFIPNIDKTTELHNSYYNTHHMYYNDEPIVLKEEKHESAEYESIAQGNAPHVSTPKSHESAASLTGPSLSDGTELRQKESPTTEQITEMSTKPSQKKERTSEKLKSGYSNPPTHPSTDSIKDNQATTKQQQSKLAAKQSNKSPSSSSSESTLKKSKPEDSPIIPGTPDSPSKAEAGNTSVSKAHKMKSNSRKSGVMTKRLKQSKGIKELAEESEEEKTAKELTRVRRVRGGTVYQQLPNILFKVEGLKNLQSQDTNYEEVQELKEQIQIMRRELESQIDSEDTSDKSVTSGEELNSPSSPDQISIKGTEEEFEEEQETPREEDADEGNEEEEKTTSITDEDIEQYEQLKFDRTVRRLLAEGHTTSYERAEVAAQLLNLSFDETDSIQAAEGCSSLYSALQFLQQECELCAEKYPMGKMVSMLHCTHRCCYECANTYFSFQVKTKNIRELRCPFCNEPDLDESEEIAAEYLNNLDILLKNILDQETHELFQRKLRDWTLMKDPNFRWCNKCSSGFIANPRARKLICPDCKDVTCAQCRKQWEPTHVGITCEAFAKWKEENDPEMQAESVAQHLAENGITCPNCRFTYSLAKGGCMHFTCTECKYEFCSGCSQPFKQGAKCPVGPYCERLGLHAHHPRNCLFYLRDKEPGQLQQLLKEHGIEFDTEPSSGAENPKRLCQVQEQKETTDGLRDDICGRLTHKDSAGLCRLHYIEYLVEKINNHGLDPVSIFDEADLRVCLRRNGKTVPIRRWESEKLYRDKLIKLIKEQLPLT